jgi:hypothetical protein
MLLAGASGLVGGLVLGLCPDAIPITRRPIGRPGVVADFDDLPPLPQAQVAVCALGTTRAKAGSDAAFRAVDHDAVLAFARAAKAAAMTPRTKKSSSTIKIGLESATQIPKMRDATPSRVEQYRSCNASRSPFRPRIENSIVV